MTKTRITMDPEYDPSHKTSSITSTTSSNSYDTVPSLTTSSIFEVESSSLNEASVVDGISGDVVGHDKSFTDTLHINDDAINQSQKAQSHSLDDHFHTVSGGNGSPLFLCQSHDITIPHSVLTKKEPARKLLLAAHTRTETGKQATSTSIMDSNNRSSMSIIGDEEGSFASRQIKQSHDLLTEDERRTNHIASEQKRRNAIRIGFKEMTEIIPTLKNVNNSKSTILFKAVDYICHLNKSNRGLRDKLNSLQVRLEIQGCIGGLVHAPSRLLQRRHSQYYNEHHSKRNRPNCQHYEQLPLETLAAILVHQNQQKQLEMMQEQLRYQQDLLSKYDISTSFSGSPHSNQHQTHLLAHAQSSLSPSPSSSMSIPINNATSSTTRVSDPSSLLLLRPSIYNQISSPLQSLYERQHQHRLSAPALVVPDTTYERSSIFFSTAPLLGASSFNIPADDDFDGNLAISSKLHP